MNTSVNQCILNNSGNSIPEINTLIENIKHDLISEKDEYLLKLTFSQNPTEAELAEFLSEWDIEVNGGHKALLLSYFMKMHPELTFPVYVAPRLNGLLKYYKFQNMKLISHFIKITKLLNTENIPVMIFKGGAMKYYRPEFSRVMGDIDIIVPENDYKKACEIAINSGYDATDNIHSLDLHIKGTLESVLDIHKYICMNTGKELLYNPKLFSRAEKCSVFGVNAFVPAKEDMFFIALVNLARNLTEKTSSNGIIYTLFDCKYLINSKSDFDMNIVKENAEITDTKEQICLAVKFINSVIPNFLDGKVTLPELFDKELNEYFKSFIYQRFLLIPMKTRGHELTISKALKNKKIFKEYIGFKPKYLLYKQKFIKNNPKFVNHILKHEKLISGEKKC